MSGLIVDLTGQTFVLPVIRRYPEPRGRGQRYPEPRGIQSFRTRGPFVPRRFVPRLRRFVATFDQFVPNPLDDSYPTNYDTKMFKTKTNIYSIYRSNRKTIKMHAPTRKVYVWSYFIYCWTLLNKSASGPRQVSVICFFIVYICEFLDNNISLLSFAK